MLDILFVYTYFQLALDCSVNIPLAIVENQPPDARESSKANFFWRDIVSANVRLKLNKICEGSPITVLVQRSVGPGMIFITLGNSGEFSCGLCIRKGKNVVFDGPLVDGFYTDPREVDVIEFSLEASNLNFGTTIYPIDSLEQANFLVFRWFSRLAKFMVRLSKHPNYSRFVLRRGNGAQYQLTIPILRSFDVDPTAFAGMRLRPSRKSAPKGGPTLVARRPGNPIVDLIQNANNYLETPRDPHAGWISEDEFFEQYLAVKPSN